VTIVETDPTDHNLHYKTILKRLQNAKLENGKSPVIVVLPMPKRLEFDGFAIASELCQFPDFEQLWFLLLTTVMTESVEHPCRMFSG
jgi:hypothetical protein